MPSPNMETFLALKDAANFEKDLTSEQSQGAMLDAFAKDIVVVEPPSLPQGGVHQGIEAWQEMHHLMRSLWLQKVDVKHVWDVPEDDLIVLYSEMEWTANATGKSVTFPAVELLHFRDAKIAKIEMFLQDSKVILDTLEHD
jgi:uncharacterized protein